MRGKTEKELADEIYAIDKFAFDLLGNSFGKLAMRQVVDEIVAKAEEMHGKEAAKALEHLVWKVPFDNIDHDVFMNQHKPAYQVWLNPHNLARLKIALALDESKNDMLKEDEEDGPEDYDGAEAQAHLDAIKRQKAEYAESCASCSIHEFNRVASENPDWKRRTLSVLRSQFGEEVATAMEQAAAAYDRPYGWHSARNVLAKISAEAYGAIASERMFETISALIKLDRAMGEGVERSRSVIDQIVGDV